MPYSPRNLPWIVVDASDSDRLPKANDSLGVTAQEHQKFFLQEIKEHLTSRLPPAASGRHTGQTRNGTGNAQVSDPSNLADPDFQVPANRKKLTIRYPFNDLQEDLKFN